MAEKPYEWVDGATLEEHSRKKHTILREYFANYLTVRCQLPQMEKFRLAVVDGFAGGGRYRCGAAGSPLIILEELQKAVEAVNVRRASEGLKLIQVECLLVLNDLDTDALSGLRGNIAPLNSAISENVPHLHLRIEYFNQEFEKAYQSIKEMLTRGRFGNVLFNLDQCGHSKVSRVTLSDIMRSFNSPEIFYTFAIQSLVTYLRAQDPIKLQAQLQPFDIDQSHLSNLGIGLKKQQWLGAAERLVFDSFRACANFVSPFSINNPSGWRYWLIHFSNVPRARQVYNNVLHRNSSEQAHFGRSGLNMLSYDPRHDEGMLYLFDASGREHAKQQLMDDIPRLVSESGDVINMPDFYTSIYNATPAHSEDIHQAIIDNPDLEVITPGGGERRRASTISIGDMLKLKRQTSFFPMF